ncbi:butyrophilin subfamily 2 member A2-like [Menidia menidia]
MRPLAVTTWVLLCAPLLLSHGQTIYTKVEAVLGQDYTLLCRAGKETQIIAVEWSRPDLNPDVVILLRDGHFESGGQNPSFMNRVVLQDRQMKDGDVSLILKNVTTKDTGTYLCRVIQEGGNRRKRAAPELISSIHLVVSPPGTQEGGDKEASVGDEEGGAKEGGPTVRGHPGLGLVSVLAIVAVVAVIAAVLIGKMKKTPPPPPEGATVQPLV